MTKKTTKLSQNGPCPTFMENPKKKNPPPIYISSPSILPSSPATLLSKSPSPALANYSIFFNLQATSTSNNNPVFGIWNDTANTWVTTTNDYFSASITNPGYSATPLQSYTIYTSVKLTANKTYSVRAKSNGGTITIKKLSSGSTGEGPVTQISIRRIS